jgi:serine phosphatase RsbU (regulator of sigma subunit)
MTTMTLMRPARDGGAMLEADTAELVRHLTSEISNFEEMARCLLPQPGDVPTLRGLDIHGGTRALNGVVGGDHLIYLDFKKRFDLDARIASAADAGLHHVVDGLRRCQQRAGIALVDVSGHRITDALLAAMLHQALLLGAIYELDQFGQITRRLFENLNTRFHHSSGAHKFVSLLYGEISEDAMFRFLSAAQPFPAVFSRAHQRFMEVSPDLCVSFPPLGILPSLDVSERTASNDVLGFKARYAINEWTLMGEGDVLLLYTDGLVEHARRGEDYFPGRAEQILRETHRHGAQVIFDSMMEDVRDFSQPSDDISLVVIKRT